MGCTELGHQGIGGLKSLHVIVMKSPLSPSPLHMKIWVENFEGVLTIRTKESDFFLWLDPPLPNNHYKETMWNFYVELEQANEAKECQRIMLKLLKVVVIMLLLLLVMVTLLGFMVHKVMVQIG
ncbi:unnamed protein product [Lactuca virosa]|uniref:Uncharacterized protein n=1 Tax=Lactuca virosa TaxID=75947 RepID=A0AAU9LLK4_9ASTR|nr:unnamed protein product [Lactuca virosa]